MEKTEMETTDNLGLRKPSQDDFYNVDDFNYNAEIIDKTVNGVQYPAYEDTKKLETLSSGEKLEIAFGKIKLAITKLINHIANKSNPHGVTTNQIGAADATDVSEHFTDRENPHQVTKSQVGLGNVDNTSDVNKPISVAQQEEFDKINNEVAEKASSTHVHPVESVGATINTSNFKDSSDSWLSVRKVGHIAICTFSLVTAKQLSADTEYNICKLNESALYSLRAVASCSGNITGDVSIQNNALNYIKIALKSSLAAEKTVKGEVVFFV